MRYKLWYKKEGDSEWLPSKLYDGSYDRETAERCEGHARRNYTSTRYTYKIVPDLEGTTGPLTISVTDNFGSTYVSSVDGKTWKAENSSYAPGYDIEVKIEKRPEPCKYAVDEVVMELKHDPNDISKKLDAYKFLKISSIKREPGTDFWTLNFVNSTKWLPEVWVRKLTPAEKGDK